MEKSEKIIKRLNKKSGTIPPSSHPVTDEWKTDMQTIINELSYWGKLGKFKGKNIICPCDWDIFDDDSKVYSIRIEYDSKN